MFRMQTYRSLS